MNSPRSYDEIKVDDSVSFTRTITEVDIQLYAGITGDFNPIHTDIEFAKKSRFGERVAHGPLPLGLIAHLVGMHLPGPGTILLGMDARFMKPVKIGDTIAVTMRVVRKAEKGRVHMEGLFVNQRGELVIKSQLEVLPPAKANAA
jgi:3-hydroxybutyryl-CoA dehydratase